VQLSDLHRHLDGSLRASTLEELRRAGTIPGMTPALLEQTVQNGHAAAFRR
jgi:hypothetical protein